MDKQHILDEIRRTATENGGVPLGTARFQIETCIKHSDWYCKPWRSWGEAVRKAGYTPNELQKPFDEEYIIGKLVELIREFGRFPVAADLRIKGRSDPGFPSHNVFERIGRKAERAQKVIAYCRDRECCGDVLENCKPIASTRANTVRHGENDGDTFGFVYPHEVWAILQDWKDQLCRAARVRASYSASGAASLVHQIKTDDPVGIEEYRHNRFREMYENGEWFKPSASDVAAFRRRGYM